MEDLFTSIFGIAMLGVFVFGAISLLHQGAAEKKQAKTPLKITVMLAIIMVVGIVGSFVTSDDEVFTANQRIVEDEPLTEEELIEKHQNAEIVSYEDLAWAIDSHVGEYVTYTGKVQRVKEYGTFTNIFVEFMEKDSNGESLTSQSTVFVQVDGMTDFVEGEEITVYGEVHRKYTESESHLPVIAADTIRSETFKDTTEK